MTTDAAQIVFWASVATLAYVYVGYPMVVWILSRIAPIATERGQIEPTVTVLITAYNEELSIRNKLENTLAIDYPADKLDVLVASDGSTDATDAIVRDFGNRGVRLVRQEGRLRSEEHTSELQSH